MVVGPEVRSFSCFKNITLNLPYGFTSTIAPLQAFVVLQTQFASFAAHADLKQQRLLTSLGVRIVGPPRPEDSR